MIAVKRDQALQDVQKNRKALELDGDGDVRLRVGEAKVAGMASLKEYLLQQNPSTLTPEEFQVYQRMKGEQWTDNSHQENCNPLLILVPLKMRDSFW